MARDVALIVGSTGAPAGGALVSSPLDRVGITESVTAVKATSGRDLLVYDTYRPSVATAGITVTDYTQLNQFNASSVSTVNWTTPNVLVQDQIIHGVVNRLASNVVFKNCLFRGPPSKPSGETAMANLNDTTYSGWEFYDCTFAPQFPNANLDAVKSNNFKAFRCHMFWVVDGAGVFTNNVSPANGSTDVEIAGCLVEDLVYNPGPYFATYNLSYYQNDGTYGAQGTAVTRTSVQSSDDPWVDSGHPDGNHSDGVEVQGAMLGRMVRQGGGKWAGDGVYIHGNNFSCTDAVWNDGQGRDPSGKGIPVPGTTAGIAYCAGSRLGFGDNPKRGTNQAPGMTRPVINGAKRLTNSGLVVPNGGYASNGSGVIFVQNAPTAGPIAFPYPDATHPDDWTVVGAYNYINRTHHGFNTQPKNLPQIKYAWLHNVFGPDIFQYSSNTPSAASIYPERIYNPEKTVYANDDDGTDGMSTNIWEDPQNIWGRNGLPLINSGNRGGLRYN